MFSRLNNFTKYDAKKRGNSPEKAMVVFSLKVAPIFRAGRKEWEKKTGKKLFHMGLLRNNLNEC